VSTRLFDSILQHSVVQWIRPHFLHNSFNRLFHRHFFNVKISHKSQSCLIRIGKINVTVPSNVRVDAFASLRCNRDNRPNNADKNPKKTLNNHPTPQPFSIFQNTRAHTVTVSTYKPNKQHTQEHNKPHPQPHTKPHPQQKPSRGG
jgi:hypothetical protein